MPSVAEGLIDVGLLEHDTITGQAVAKALKAL
jgi:hypothetical protein